MADSVKGSDNIPTIGEGVDAADLPGGSDYTNGDDDMEGTANKSGLIDAGEVDVAGGAQPARVTFGADTNMGRGTAPRP